jgi:hypothetical protein
MSLARMATQLCTAPGKVLVIPCWRYIAAGRHREFQWRMFTVGQSLWSAFERVGGVLCDVWQESHTATKRVKITVGTGVSQWRYGTVGFLAGVNPLRHPHTKQIASPRKVTQGKMSTGQSRASRTSFYWNMSLRHSTFRRNFLPLRFQGSSRGVVEAFALLGQ